VKFRHLVALLAALVLVPPSTPAAFANGMPGLMPTMLLASPQCQLARAPATELLHMSGANGGTSFPDSSANALSVTVTSTTISTSQWKFRGSSASFNGTSSRLTEPTNSVLGPFTGNFTIDFWVYFSSVGASATMVSASGGGFTIQLSSRDWSVWNGSNHTAASGPSTGQWYHVALVRNGVTVTLYVNGSSVTSYSDSSTSVYTISTGLIGAHSGPSNFVSGFMDEFHVLNSTAQWTAAFTPPTAPWCN
jgi:hypothetical protein